MQMDFRIGNADVATALDRYTERRLRTALGRFGSRVGYVNVRIDSDGQSPEFTCRIVTQILPFGHVAVEERDTDLLTAIDRCCGRVGRLFGQELRRVHDVRTTRDSVRGAA